MSDEVKAFTEELVARRLLAVESLTREQLTDAITQAIKSGDFIRCVEQFGDRQNVVYIPGYEAIRLGQEVARLSLIAGELAEALTYARRFMKADEVDIAHVDAALAKYREVKS